MRSSRLLRPAMLVAAALAGIAAVLAPAPTAHATTATVDASGNLLVDGEPFFPIGIYHVSWIGNRMGRKTAPDLHTIADAGFNLMHPTIDFRNDMQELLDAASARGVYLIGEIPWPASGPQDFIHKWKAHPSIIGWNILDDFNAPYSGTPNHPVAKAIARRDVIRALAPNHLAYASGGAFPGFRIAEYAGTMDVMGFQSYPISAGNNEEIDWLEENADSWDWVRDELDGTTQHFWAVPQAFRWKGRTFTGAPRWPTAREERNMLYGALARGAKGVLYYTAWGENGVLASANPGLWSEIAREVVELKSLTPFLLHGARSEIASGHPRVHGALWTYRSQVLAVVLSTDYAASHPVAVDLPAGSAGSVHRVFPGRAETGLALEGGQLVGTIGPQDVHVVLLDTVAPGDAAPLPSAEVSPAEAAFGDPITFDASASSDGDGSVVAYEWDLGDGTLSSGPVVAHAYARIGTYPIRLTVWDEDGNPGTTTLTVNVAVTALCPPAPPAGCVRAPTGAARIDLKQPGSPSRSNLLLGWSGAAVQLGDLGDPTATTEVALCLWDAGGRVLATGARPGASEWKSLGGAGFRFADRSGSPGGLISATLRPGPAPAGLLLLKGKGAHLPALELPLVAPVTAQVRTSAGSACWEAVFPGGGGTQSDATRFKALSGS